MFATRTAIPRLSPPASFLRPQIRVSIYHPPRQPSRRAQSGYNRFNRGPRYNRFTNAQQLYALWRSNPKFRLGVGAVAAGGGVFYVYNLEAVPVSFPFGVCSPGTRGGVPLKRWGAQKVSKRRRFNVISPELEKSMGQQMYQSALQQYGRQILPPGHPSVRMVHRVLDRLIPQSGMPDQEWEVHVIDDKSQMNAFVAPGWVVPLH